MAERTKEIKADAWKYDKKVIKDWDYAEDEIDQEERKRVSTSMEWDSDAGSAKEVRRSKMMQRTSRAKAVVRKHYIITHLHQRVWLSPQ